MDKKLILILLLIIPPAYSMDSSYTVVVEENGNSLVLIDLEGSGLVNIPLQKDVDDVRIRGGLYVLNNESVDVSIGSTQEAVVLYKTSLLTLKHEVWDFSIDLADTANESVMVAIPKDAVIIETQPDAIIETVNFTRLSWEGDLESVSVRYEFPEETVVVQEENDFPYGLVAAGVAFLGVIAAVFAFKKSKKQNVIKTLSRNERIVVNAILENNGGMKRNMLERKTKLAKSSLAHTLNNLERKKIVLIDKTNATHYVKFTRWFDEL